MSQRKDDILEAAMHLFVKQGFRSTPVQEITAKSGISKGAFYKHFDSKESMMLDLLQRYYNNLLHEADKQHFSSQGSDSKLALNLRVELEKSMEYRSFFHVLFTELPPHEKGPISDYLSHMRCVIHDWHQQSLLDTFGTRVQPYLTDLTVMLEGMMHAYLMQMIWQGQTLPLGKLAAFLVQQIEAIIQQDQPPEPMLPADGSKPTTSLRGITSMINDLKALLPEIKAQDSSDASALKNRQTIEFLLEELQQEVPRVFLVDALLAQLAERPNLKQPITLIQANWETWKEEVTTL